MNRRLIPTALVVLLSASTLLGCAPQPDLSDSAAQTLQQSVQQVATLASTGDPTGATAELDALQGELDAAVDSGDVTAERSQTIQTAIDAVRADLAQQIAAAEAAAAAAAAAEAERVAAEQQAAAEKAEADRIAAEQAAAEQQAADEKAQKEAEREAEKAAREAEKNEDDKPKPGDDEE
ncbi:membrane protein involved in colicin uptake [Conyzicola lurida]|uniref:Membrane protein involved in colicin uptake n=1 Tax=Conyzicola lurida TaxID=1172621 RepID=A0A841ARJ6_9MICO|nr:mucin-associated surface protein [Conyzicola lurida]MBB5844049.1 membrane protein involved in colicin uptake [Conyzicola lurida]